MKSQYLIAAAITVVVMSEPQRTNNDIIWYPVEDEEGVYISTFGEKRRTTEEFKWRSHRRARYSGTGMSFAVNRDPNENSDPSFFHNINDRKPLLTNSDVSLVYQSQKFLPETQKRRSRQQANQNVPERNFREIINEVFDYKGPYASEIIEAGWSSRPIVTNQPQWSNGAQQSPTSSRRPWSISSFPDDGRDGQARGTDASLPLGKPGGVEWTFTQSGSTESVEQRPTGPTRPGVQSDKLVFPGETSGTSAPPTPSPCERTCPVTPEFNPVCGSDAVTYSNAGRLKCAQLCGKNVKLSHHGNCGKTPLVTPLLSASPTKNLRGFFF